MSVLRDVFAGLSEESRHSRFLVPLRELGEQYRASLLDTVDQHDHVALVLCTSDTHEPVGVGRWVRLPGDPTTAEVAVTVVDARQGRGAGSQLVDALAERAAALGVRRFAATVLNGNAAPLALLARVGTVVERGLDGPGATRVVVELAPRP